MRVTIIRIDRERAEKNPPTGGCMPRTGFEPARLAALPPQSSASANSATWAFRLRGELYALVPRCRDCFAAYVRCWGMAKVRTQFLCNQCGSVHPKWMGKCPDCGAWDALEEYKQPTADARRESLKWSSSSNIAQGADALTLAQIEQNDADRTPTGVA